MITAHTGLGGTASSPARAADLTVSAGVDDHPLGDGDGKFYWSFLELALDGQHRCHGPQIIVYLEGKGFR